MLQTKLRSKPACQGKEDGNISIPIGLSKVFENYFEIIGMNDLLNGFKLKGAALAPLVRCMCVHSLDDHDNSLQSCADWTSNPYICELLDLNGPQSQRTFNRALQILGDNRVKIIERLFDGIRANFDADDISVAVDGSAVKRESDYDDMAGTGHPRDKNPDGMQTEFMMAVYQESKIPFYVGRSAERYPTRNNMPVPFRRSYLCSIMVNWMPTQNIWRNGNLRIPAGRTNRSIRSGRMPISPN